MSKGAGPRNKKNWNVESIMKDFFRRYPTFFQGGRVELCSKMYYPVALLELEMLESAGEEFDTIEHAILTLIYAGIEDPAHISDVLGLPIHYTLQIIDILQGYGHVTSMRVTELGAKSVDEKVKFTKMLVRQKVQADTITGLLLDKRTVQQFHTMYSADETNLKIPHLAPRSHLMSETFEQVNQVIAKYKYSENAIFHANVESVEAIVSKEIKYAQALLLKFVHLPQPLVLLQGRDGYVPFAISESVKREVGELPDDIRVVPDDDYAPLTQLVGDIQAGLANNEKELRRLKAKAARCFGNMVNTERLTIDSSKMQVELELPSMAIDKINKEIYTVLESVALSEYNVPFMWLGRDDEFVGMVCYVRTNVPQLRDFSHGAVKLWLEQPAGSDIYNALIGRLDFQVSQALTLDQLQQALNAIIAEQDQVRYSEVRS